MPVTNVCDKKVICFTESYGVDVGYRASARVVDHPGYGYEEYKDEWITTSKVLSVDDATGNFETLYSKYVKVK